MNLIKKKSGDWEEKIALFNFWNWLNENRLIIVFLISLVLIVYFNSLNNDFVADDIPGILQNPAIGDFNSVLKAPLGFLRPLLYFFAHWIGNLNPFPYHLFSLFFHLGAVLTVYLLVYLLTNSFVALTTASLFAVHPLLIEAVSWISGAAYSQYGFFLILALLLYLFSLKEKKFYLLSLFAFMLALFSSERSIIFSGIIFIFFLAFEKNRSGWKKLIPFFLISGLWMLFYFSAIPQRINSLQTNFYQKPEMLNPLLQIPVAISSYLELIFWPKDLTLYHSEMLFSQGEYLLRLAVFLLFLGFTVWLFFKNRPLSFWPGLFLIGLLPTLTPFGISWIVAERYAYFSSLGIFVLIALALERISQTKFGKKTVPVILGIILILLSGRTIARNMDWQNQDTLWLAAAKTSPSSPQNHNNLGDYYGRLGEYEKAVEEFKKAIELQPNYGDAYHNLANTYQQIGKIDLAIENYQKALEFNPGLWQSLQNLAVIYFQSKDFEKAAQYQEKAVEIDPQNASLHFNLGVIYLEKNQKEKADQEFQKAFDLDPKLKESSSL